MADPDSYAIVFKRALAQHLADQGVAVYSTGSYAATDRGIYTNGPTMPTTTDNCLVLTWLQPIADGRSDMLYRVQVFSRIKGNTIAAENLAGAITAVLDYKANVPPGMQVAWCELFSELLVTADSSGRCGTFQTFHFTGRRP
ncbi:MULTISPECIES: hypothetical protein [unclassified Cryobacterium]|uniref:hypothetical protein n=1 Tax=unclassified Cryobacterium TaxID=2649013 RepID=UPI002AB37F17|nr:MULTISPECIES: hypothetical protein [unclassified Cryobacterium]MDY7542601.1 hypothetical protein [Cryobacterium sp. 5B3]MEB0264721.1 hypothetical protein [Cryobacterium sp. 10I5]MEB0273693.1 hypothetical protein [Cryobacterium sp. 5B3]